MSHYFGCEHQTEQEAMDRWNMLTQETVKVAGWCSCCFGPALAEYDEIEIDGKPVKVGRVVTCSHCSG